MKSQLIATYETINLGKILLFGDGRDYYVKGLLSPYFISIEFKSDFPRYWFRLYLYKDEKVISTDDSFDESQIISSFFMLVEDCIEMESQNES
jgi:hypothetical protein